MNNKLLRTTAGTPVKVALLAGARTKTKTKTENPFRRVELSKLRFSRFSFCLSSSDLISFKKNGVGRGGRRLMGSTADEAAPFVSLARRPVRQAEIPNDKTVDAYFVGW